MCLHTAELFLRYKRELIQRQKESDRKDKSDGG
jgi:hypothetical protein